MDEKERVVEAARIPGMILPDLARWVVEESLLLADERTPFHGAISPGDGRVLLVVGENASGKSLAFRLIASLAASHGVEAMTLSIRERTGGGPDAMARMRRAFVYGEEETSSTGSTSVQVVRTGFGTLAGRTSPALLAFDEPEIGLSDGYAEALGEYIGAQAHAAPPASCGVIVVTHSRRLAQGLVRGLGAEPTMLAMLTDANAATPSVGEWIASRETRSVEDLMRLGDTALERFRAVRRLIADARDE